MENNLSREEWIKSLKVGSEVWVSKPNYRTNKREFDLKTIDGETSRSWLIGENNWNETKYPKKTAAGLYQKQETEDMLFVDENHYIIGRAVIDLRTITADQLRRIQAITEEGK